MKFQRLLELVYNQPWVITPSAHATIRAILDAHVKGVKLEMDPGDMQSDEDTEMTKVGTVAVIPVHGVIGKNVSAIQKSSGVCDVEDLCEMFDEACQDSFVTHIMLDVDSPGGGVGGVCELAAKIANCSKPVMAWTDDQCASGAYWLCSGATAIYCSPTASVGGIGVYLPYEDQTKAYQQAGIKVEVVKNKEGTYKGMGLPGTSLTDEQRSYLQAHVDDIFQMFSGAVTAKRKVGPDAMRGQTFMGAKALAAGLVDEVCDFETAFRDCQKL